MTLDGEKKGSYKSNDGKKKGISCKVTLLNYSDKRARSQRAARSKIRGIETGEKGRTKVKSST